MKSIPILFFAICITCCKNAEPSYHVEHPLTQPQGFTNDSIFTLNGINFSSDGKTLFTSQQLDKKFDNNRNYAGIFESHFENGHWTEPQQVKFSFDIDAYHPVLSIDNETLFFNSRSHLDSLNKSVPHDIWSVQKTTDGWGTPSPMKIINSSSYDSYPSLAKNKNLYFNSDREGGRGGMDIYVSEFKDGKYQPPENLDNINSPDSENDLVVDPEERFIIFNRYINATGELDMYVSYNGQEGWTLPQKLEIINSQEKWELTPTLSPDGKYFFYELDSRIMQIDLSSLINLDEIK